MSVTIESSFFDNGITADSLLEALHDARVFSVDRLDDGHFHFEESCDSYFGATLTKDQVLMLADELRALVAPECAKPAPPGASERVDAALGLVELPPIRVSAEVHAALERQAKHYGLIVQAIVREAIDRQAAQSLCYVLPAGKDSWEPLRVSEDGSIGKGQS